MTDISTVKVIQADREAAADLSADPLMLTGEYDHSGIVQAFARHRLSHLPQGEVSVTARELLAAEWEAGGNEYDRVRADQVRDAKTIPLVPADIALRAIERALSSRPQWEGEVRGLREALEGCRDKFREYERLHRAKVKPGPFYAHTNEDAKAKANRNAEMAEMCEAALYHAALDNLEKQDG